MKPIRFTLNLLNLFKQNRLSCHLAAHHKKVACKFLWPWTPSCPNAALVLLIYIPNFTSSTKIIVIIYTQYERSQEVFNSSFTSNLFQNITSSTMPLLFSMAEHYEETVGVEETMNPYSRSKNERLP